eukprot:TRINITY_DN7703_c0_g3_i2.p1 TRINITY_DN7703_c0_g3~~TRINITY_DN7703_c0_g3_i2.p1  ORF type:complete len:289 (-),score=40.76 TRINITY_DN7703_c0_g3_i2:598-1464(-)
MSFISCRSRSIHGFLSLLSPSLLDKKSLLFYSSSSSSSSEYSNFYSVSSKKESFVYQNALKCRRPPTVPQYRIPFRNSVTFIGSVLFPVKKYSSCSVDSVWTMLEVESPGKSKPTFKVLLEMRGEMAEISLQHLMENDFVYVSGRLNSYTKVDSSGRDMLFYKVIVKEFNYVKHNNQCRTFQKPEALKLKSVSTSSALDSQMVETVRLHLWQVFFASPHEWWDNRGRKLYPSSPDFKHKDTGERLWIMPNDPPWVTKQLQLLDSKITERGQGGLGSARSRLSMWEYEE